MIIFSKYFSNKAIRIINICFFIAILFFSFGSSQSSLLHAEETAPGQSGYKLLVDCRGDKGCDFNDFIRQINKIIKFLFYAAVLLATIAFVYCGFLFLTAGGDAGKAKEAKEIFFKVVMGFIWIFIAFLVVQFIVGIFELRDDAKYNLLKE
jgi:hypothetical protein